jgi:hypothetical protein
MFLHFQSCEYEGFGCEFLLVPNYFKGFEGFIFFLFSGRKYHFPAINKKVY